jgi:glycosyltransferase involved in cell wall biosynthesis
MQKVLHVVENLNHGAVENWLLRMLRFGRRSGVSMDWAFYCALGALGRLDAEARALGARVIHSPVPIGSKVDFVRGLRAELRRGKYDVMHCHHDIVSAVYLLAAAGIPIRRRIVHVHNADEAVLTPSRLKRLVYREPARRVCLVLADRVVGISNHTLDTFLAGRARRFGQDLVHYYGVDPAPFANATGDRAGFRRQLGLPADALILLFAGRVVPEKNPVFAVDVLAELRRIEPRSIAVFAGAGSQEHAVLARVRELDLENSVRMLGWRDDLAEIMSCSDWFILPRVEHPMEGFGLAVVEAQLAGLRMLLSAGIADDPLLPTASYQRLPLAAGARAWAQAAAQLLHGRAASPAEARAALEASPFAMKTALAELISLHQENDLSFCKHTRKHVPRPLSL